MATVFAFGVENAKDQHPFVIQEIKDFVGKARKMCIRDSSWSKDGNLVYCRDHDYRTAYVFGEKNDNAPTESSGAKQVVLLLAEHGGPGISFFDYKFDSTTLVWRDFVPSENN